MDERQQKESELMRHIVNRQAEALGKLYDQYGRLVYSVALRILNDAHQAEEVTLDTFHTIWQKASTFNAQKGGVATWITRIARNKALDQIRKEKVRLNKQAVQWEPNSQTAVTHPSTETIIGVKQRQERIQAALAQLPQEQKQVITMAFFLDYSQSQIAQNLEIPLGTVKTRIRLGMTKLRHLLKAEDEKIG